MLDAGLRVAVSLEINFEEHGNMRVLDELFEDRRFPLRELGGHRDAEIGEL